MQAKFRIGIYQLNQLISRFRALTNIWTGLVYCDKKSLIQYCHLN